MKIAILDDYVRQSQLNADWSKLAATCDITVFDRPLALPDEAARILAPFDVICLLRERMPVCRMLIDRLPNLNQRAAGAPYRGRGS